MNQSYPEYWPQYFTATIYEWKHVLAHDECKDMVPGSGWSETTPGRSEWKKGFNLIG